MNPTLLFSNLSVWWLQVALVTAAATVLSIGLRIPAGRGKLWFWQVVLVACLAAPVMGTWQHEVVSVSTPAADSVAAVTVANVQPVRQIPWLQIIFYVLATGAIVRLCLLVAGLFRLRRYRLDSSPLVPESSWSGEADVRLSAAVPSPVTFGFPTPVILLPIGFPGLPPATRDAILCHEILHVRRHDWLFTLGEELVRGLLWFHPAIWWIINEIQLAREQAVDAAVVEMLNARDQYVDALLSVAGAGSAMDLAPAPLFLRKRHLKQRLISILKEGSMSKTQRISALTASFALLAGSCWIITNAVPMTAAPQFVNDAPGVTVNTSGLTLIHRSGIAYPAAVAAHGVEGVVQVQVKLDASGSVSDANVLSGPDELRKVVLASVLDWHFSKAAANSTRQISVTFESPRSAAQVPVAVGITRSESVSVSTSMSAPQPAQAEPRTLRSLVFRGLSEDAQAELLAKLPVHIEDKLTNDLMRSLTQVVREYDEHLGVTFMLITPNSIGVSIGYNQQQMPLAPVLPVPVRDASGQFPVRVGTNVSAANVIRQVKPVYPSLAKEARVQGIVKLDAIIGVDGHVENLKVISGHPLLIQAAIAAVQEWIYKPTLLNGQPTAIATNIDVNFTLAE